MAARAGTDATTQGQRESIPFEAGNITGLLLGKKVGQ
jgi:hypothetical protein